MARNLIQLASLIRNEVMHLISNNLALAIIALSFWLMVTLSLTIFIMIKIKRFSNPDYPGFYSLPKDRSPAQISDEETRAIMDAFDVKQ